MNGESTTKWLIAIGAIIVVVFVLFGAPKDTNAPTGTSTTSTPRPTSQMSKTYSSAPEQFLDANKKYQVTMKTSDGDMTIELFNKETPIAANNFAFLVKEGFYDGLSFHRIIKGFMIQGGDPSGDGTGGPGYEIKDEPVTRDYKRGVIAYANSGANTSGSQFFIMHADYPLPKQYTIFGQVVSGLETIDKIADTPVEGNMYGEQSTPTEPVFIESARLNEVQ